MDLDAVTEVCGAADAGGWRPGDAWLAGGTSLFSQPQPRITRLLDLFTLGWEPLQVAHDGLEIAATCTIAGLSEFVAPPEWAAWRRLFPQCRRAFLASFKIWNVATVGGNVCTASPAGPMISLAAALDGSCTVVTREGGRRHVPVVDLVTGAGTTALAPGELLRSVFLPATALRGRVAFRRGSLHPGGVSATLVIGSTGPRDTSLAVTVTAATPRPVRVLFPRFPDAATLRHAVDRAIPVGAYLDDLHGQSAWRRHLTRTFAEEIRAELASGGGGGR